MQTVHTDNNKEQTTKDARYIHENNKNECFSYAKCKELADKTSTLPEGLLCKELVI